MKSMVGLEIQSSPQGAPGAVDRQPQETLVAAVLPSLESGQPAQIDITLAADLRAGPAAKELSLVDFDPGVLDEAFPIPEAAIVETGPASTQDGGSGPDVVYSGGTSFEPSTPDEELVHEPRLAVEGLSRLDVGEHDRRDHLDDGNVRRGGPDSAAITVTAAGVNQANGAIADPADAPYARDDAAPTAVDAVVTIDVLSNDGDPNGDPVAVAAVTQGASGTVVINPDDTVSYTPNGGFSGVDSFTYTAGDGNGGTDSATATVYVGIATVGGSGKDTISGTNGDDVIFGHEGNDRLSGGKGDDTLYGGDGNDVLNGQNGDDELFGNAGDDTLNGNQGDDYLDGGAGSDSLSAGNGDDILVWDFADRSINGGAGSDTLLVDHGDADIAGFAGTIRRIEQVDLDSDDKANTLTLSAQDVLDMSDTNVVKIFGDSNDAVEAGMGWTDGGIDGNGYQIFTQTVGGSLATLLVDPDIAVNPDVLA